MGSLASRTLFAPASVMLPTPPAETRCLATRAISSGCGGGRLTAHGRNRTLLEQVETAGLDAIRRRRDRGTTLRPANLHLQHERKVASMSHSGCDWRLLDCEVRTRLVRTAKRDSSVAVAYRYGHDRIIARQRWAGLHCDRAPAGALVAAFVNTAKLVGDCVVVASSHPAKLHPV